MLETSGRRVLVTGGAGFIGSHLVDQLLRQGWEVTVLDNLSNGKRSHVERFSQNSSVRFIEGDVADPTLMRRLIRDCEPEVVYHLAALHFIPFCIANPFETLRTNVLGTQALLDVIPNSSVRKLVFTSTGDVYSDKPSPHTEEDPTGPQNVYGQSKLWCEQLLDLSRNHITGVSLLVARLFNVYGPRETNPHVVPEIIELLRKGDVLPLGNVDARRDYVYCSDVAEALIRIAMYEGNLNVFNVGTGRETSVHEIVHVLGQILDRDLFVTRDEKRFRKIDRPHLCADTSRLFTEVGWVPNIGIAEGLKELLRFEGFLTNP